MIGRRTGHRRILNGAALAALALVAGLQGASVAAEDPAATVVLGRWRGVEEPFVPAGETRIAMIDVMTCGEGRICAREVGADGACGRLVLRLRVDPKSTAGAPMYLGEFIGVRRTAPLNAYVERDEFDFVSMPDGSAAGSRRAMPYYAGRFKRAGAAQCAAPTS